MPSPYYAVIFTSIRNTKNKQNNIDYNHTAEKIENLAKKQDGYLGIEHFYNKQNKMSITISYWKSLDDIKKWKLNIEHANAQEKGKNIWYKYYKIRIAKVEREYQFHFHSKL